MSAHARTCENGAHRGHVGNHMKAPVSKTSAPKNMTRGSNRKTTSNRESNGEGPSRSQTLQETLLASEVSKDKEPEGVPTEDKGKQKEVLTHVESPGESSTTLTESSVQNCHINDHYTIDDLQAQILVQQKITNELQIQLQQKDTEITANKFHISRLQTEALANAKDPETAGKLTECENLYKLCEMLKRDKDDLERQLEEARGMIVTLKQRVAELESENERLKAEMNGDDAPSPAETPSTPEAQPLSPENSSTSPRQHRKSTSTRTKGRPRERYVTTETRAAYGGGKWVRDIYYVAEAR
ncbi:hypothetical protein L207DRAFT_593931 [Hyaloscypha variabilis F]|uniref:Uncharacterized protein n=1 Tax=Hyaloscypha variabilis (strain UAMH 11265 / GT02V1 / F) TaxID=1149755 RepID=A0A2J6QRR3_HYAVF|nr:hypothetical protein L207DRAFT_593931 [Hyaloscypha variabilis F]